VELSAAIFSTLLDRPEEGTGTSTETSVKNYESSCCHISEGYNFYQQARDDLKSFVSIHEAWEKSQQPA
jgi:hypothetical protein